MRSSIGFGAYDGFGYANEPQWGLFNPAQSLFKSDPTLYDSLYATNHDAGGGVDQARAKVRANQHPGLPNQVGPRKAWQRNVDHKQVGAHNRMGGLGGLGDLGEGIPKGCCIAAVLAIAAVGFFLWKKKNS